MTKNKRFVFDPSIYHFTDTMTDKTYCEYNLDEVVDMLNDLDCKQTAYYSSNEVLREEVQRLEKENEYLKLENEGLKYALENYKKIDVEVVLDD